MERHFTEIKIDRPLIFLCGPLISEKRRQLDRRIILRDFITTNLQRRDKKTIIYQPIPIIVDEIFKKDYIDTYNLNLSLLEEIISSISFHTYIFLDTFSTSMELGLFSNSSASNAITVLVPEETRKNVKIGGFISTSIDHNPTIDICNYSSLIQTHENTDYVSFINNDLPDELANKVTSDNLEIAQKSKSSSIEVGLSGVIPLSHNVINYNVELGKLQCYVHFRTLFYLVSTIINEYNSNFVPIEIDNFVPEIARQLKKELLNIFLNQDKSELYLFEKANSVLKPPRTQVFTSLNNELHTLISDRKSVV